MGPGCEETAVVGGWGEGGVVPREGLVDVFQGRGCGCWILDGEGEPVGLVVVVVGVLADDYGFYGVEGGVAGPVGGGVSLLH